MNATLVLIVTIVVLIAGYVLYGGWLARQWGVDSVNVTPAHEAGGWRRLRPRAAVRRARPPLPAHRARQHHRLGRGRRGRLDVWRLRALSR